MVLRMVFGCILACFWIYLVPNLGNETCFEFEFPSTHLWTQTKGTCLPIALLLFRSHPLFCHSTIEEHVFRRARIGPCNPMKAHVLRPWETSCETIFFHHSFAVLRNQLSIVGHALSSSAPTNTEYFHLHTYVALPCTDRALQAHDLSIATLSFGRHWLSSCLHA